MKDAQAKLLTMLDDALIAIHDAVKDVTDSNNRLKAAIAILKNYGVLKESVEMNHQFPKPTIIERSNGTQVILGTEADRKDGE